MTDSPSIQFTPAQKAAMTHAGSSVIVSAAAGSGKTAVLAERCVWLIADAPAPHRCDIDQLLVTTFTEAAAAEMRERIAAAIQRRLRSEPNNGALRRQLTLIDGTQISTIHSFCWWVLRRWFSQAGIDPNAEILDEQEAVLLRNETLTRLFEELYGAGEGRDDGFIRWVDHYGLGSDVTLGAFVLRLAAFMDSLPDPDAWILAANERWSADPHRLLETERAAMVEELTAQTDYCRRAIKLILARAPDFVFYADRVGDYVQAMEGWLERLSGSDPARFREVQAEIAALALSTKGAPRVGRDADEAKHARRDLARDLHSKIKSNLFEPRLRDRFARFSPDEWVADLARARPYAEAILAITQRFRRAYAEAKRARDVLDFADLERLTYELLTQPTHDDAELSPVVQLQQRFAHVLVDEFQDINPLQEALLRLVSREARPDLLDNLFTVGDVKQSIYRFRLAEPGMFLRRHARLGAGQDGRAIVLSHNFRSQPKILEAVNQLFGRLMRPSMGGVVYDEDARLRPGSSEYDQPGAAESLAPVEIHLLEKDWETGPRTDSDSASGPDLDSDADSGAGETATTSDIDDWTAAQREAAFIGRRIRELVCGAGFQPAREGAGDSCGAGFQPAGEEAGRMPAPQQIAYRDVVILMRSPSVRANVMAAILSRMGIPVYCETAGGYFEALEIQDVMSLLRVCDNLQQDIPLAAVLRSGVLGQSLDESDLVMIRCLDRQVPFHGAVRAYADRGADPSLRERLADLLDQIAHWRREFAVRPVDETLWQVYGRTGYMAYVGGLPYGEQRRANLLKLHERARQFGTFTRQGLHRFVEFIDSLQKQGEDLSPAASVGESEDVVRIMSIHKSKGLEFPVVFLCDLGRRFNLSDSRGSMIFDRDEHLGLMVVDPEKRIRYAPPAYRRVAARIELQSRAEELRVLYVAMTRAKQRLILVGTDSLDRLERNRALWLAGHDRPGGSAGAGPAASASDPDPLPHLAVVAAQSPLDWLIPALATMPPSGIRWNSHSSDGDRDKEVFTVYLHDQSTLRSLTIPRPDPTRPTAWSGSAATLGVLSLQTAPKPDDPQVEEIIARLESVYPQTALTSLPSVVGVSEFQRRFAVFSDSDDRVRPSAHLPVTVVAPKFMADPDRDPPASEIGAATHAVLQRVDLSGACDAADIRRQIDRLAAEGAIARNLVGCLDVEALAWFFTTPLGRRFRSAGSGLAREMTFVSSISPAELDSGISAQDGRDRILVRGIMDAAIDDPEGLELIDFKTDRVSAEQVDERAAHYSTQMRLYARALADMRGRPVDRASLVFLSPRRIVTQTEFESALDLNSLVHVEASPRRFPVLVHDMEDTAL